jgi:hypothetical protein
MMMQSLAVQMPVVALIDFLHASHFRNRYLPPPPVSTPIGSRVFCAAPTRLTIM